MTDHPAWRPLPVAAPGIPNLLVSTAFTAESYNVHLTDLANVWVEKMERKPIVKRGLVEDTSIDPSDGPDQIRRMLQLIRAAFDTNEPEHPNTSLTLAKGDSDDSIVVHITCILPKPFKPFKWPMHLTKCPQSALATELVLPLIQAYEAKTRAIEDLISALREKDGVITRLVDKLETTGTGLEHVFTSLSGKRKVTRTSAEGKIKGLAPFSEADFRSNLADGQLAAGSSDVPSVLDLVFGGVGLGYKSHTELEASTSLNSWWTELGKGRSVTLVSRFKEKTPEAAPKPLPKNTDVEEDDGFQVQATPPGLAARKRDTATRAHAVDDDETSDGEDVPDDPAPVLSPSNKTRGSRIGALGGRKRSPTASPAQVATQKTPGDDQSDTASDPEEDEEMAASPPASPARTPSRRTGLGRIGGNRRAESPAAETTLGVSPASPRDESSPPVKKHKLGVIGKKGTNSTVAANTESTGGDDRGRRTTPSAELSKSHHRETSQERADRKRAELQRELERKAAAGPAKKKRRF